MSQTEQVEEIPWVLDTEGGGVQCLTKWDGERVEGYQNWCGTCGWRGQVYETCDEAYSRDNDGRAHWLATGHESSD